jgi:5-methylcytosine-specific restriction endonuclease McrA
MIGDLKILVLNADYQPLNITTFAKGYKLVYKGKAEILKADETNRLRLVTKEVARPKIIRLLTYIYLPYRRVTLNKQNIFKRDGYACVYCQSRDNLTLDHVLPRSRGGVNSWENLVTCCSKCNCKKDNKTPEEAGMTMRHKPSIPTFSTLISISKEEIFSDILLE